MKDSFTETGMKNICDREPRIVERCLVCIAAVRVNKNETHGVKV